MRVTIYNRDAPEGGGLRGLVPESHDCVDCGVNTAPGVPNRVDLEAAFNSGAEEVSYTITDQCEMYMVRDAV
jgi:hypothetical protein